MYQKRYEIGEMSREEWLEYRREMKQEKREAEVKRQKKMILQKLMGIGMLLMSVLVFVMASHAQARGDLDGTPLIFTVPAGLILLFSKECYIV